MRIKKPKFWDTRKNIFSYLLFPITTFVFLFIILKKKITKVKNFKIPIVCIGNIYIGGTGKTPLSIKIAKELEKVGRNPVIVKKFYENQIDEHLLIREKNVPLVTHKRRDLAIDKAEIKFDLAILDDGFQDYSIKKDLSILCFNSNQLIGNGLLIPSGPLRENLNEIKRAQIIIINGTKNTDFEKSIFKINKKIKIFYSIYELNNANEFKESSIHAMAGIGNPNNFFDLLEKNGLKIKKKIPYPDHYEFDKNEIMGMVENAKKDDSIFLTTEKDFLRIKKFEIQEINCCFVNLKIFGEEKLLNEINKLYD